MFLRIFVIVIVIEVDCMKFFIKTNKGKFDMNHLMSFDGYIMMYQSVVLENGYDSFPV